MIFEELIKENKTEFIRKVVYLCTFLGVRPEHLMFLMWFETAHTLNHKIRNKVSGATGLIQFMPSTARALGTTCEALANMTNIEQLEYVYAYLFPYKGKMKDWLDLYCAIFWPKAIGQPDTYRITNDIVARQNPIFDINKDMDIEKSEIRAALIKQIPKKYLNYFV